MATITYRALSATGDPLAGGGQSNFVTDINAVAQAIATRLRFLQGEWWENLNAGTPLFQSVLGVAGAGRNPEALTLVITARILGTPYVTGVSHVQTSYGGPARTFQFSCQATTAFGTLTVTNQQPGASATLAV